MGEYKAGNIVIKYVIADDALVTAKQWQRQLEQLDKIVKNCRQGQNISFQPFLIINNKDDVSKIYKFAKDPLGYQNDKKETLTTASIVLVLTDNNMDGEKNDGVAVAKKLRTNKEIVQEHFSIIIVSADTNKVKKVSEEEKLDLEQEKIAVLEKGKCFVEVLYRTIATALQSTGIELPINEIIKKVAVKSKSSMPQRSESAPIAPVAAASGSLFAPIAPPPSSSAPIISASASAVISTSGHEQWYNQKVIAKKT